MKKIAILGAGISGLTTAFLLKKKGHKVTLFEKSHRTGGYVGTQYKDKYVVEGGANGFLNNEPHTLDLINQLGLHDELISSREDASIRYLMFDGKMRKVPSALTDFLTSDLISPAAKLKVVKETWFPPSIETDAKTSIYDFVKLRFGEEIAENIVRTALLGIFAGDAKLLAVDKTLKKYVNLEQEHKSLLKGLKASVQKNGKSQLMSFKKGMQTFVDKLTSELGSEVVELSQDIIKISKNEARFIITTQSDEDERNFTKFDEVIMTLPAPEIAKLMGNLISPELAKQFATFPVAPVRTLTFAFKEKVNFSGFGTLVSPKENLNILGFLHPKDIFENRCPEDKDLFTVMMGGTFKPEIMKMSTQAAFDTAIKDLEKILGKLPPVEHFWNWSHTPGISQYNTDQVDFMNEVELKFEQIPNMHLNSQMIGGVAINDCIRKSFELASRF